MKLHKIKYPEKIEYTEVDNYQGYKQDDNCFLLIRIKDEKIEVGICNYKYELIKAYTGTNMKSLYKRIIDDKWITEMKHAAYLGMELATAYYCLKTSKEYIQESA